MRGACIFRVAPVGEVRFSHGQKSLARPLCAVASTELFSSYPLPVPIPPKKHQSSASKTRIESEVGKHKLDKTSWMEDSAVLTKMICRSANGNVRDAVLWNRYVQRVVIMVPRMTSRQIVYIFYSFARIRYRDLRIFEALSPFLLKHLDEFTVQDVVLILNSHKKLEVRKYDNIELLLNQICLHIRDSSALDIALTCNALGHFQFYHTKFVDIIFATNSPRNCFLTISERFWSKALKRLPKLFHTLSGQHIANIVGAMARLDIRDAEALLLFAKVIRKPAKSLPQEMLSILVNSFAKLDFNHSTLNRAFHMAMHRKLEQAAKLPAREQIRGRENDSFDLQSLVLLSFSTICLTGCSDELTIKLLRAIAPHSNMLGAHKLKKLKSVECVLRLTHPALFGRLDDDLKKFLDFVRNSETTKLGEFRSRWAKEVFAVLREMGVQVDSYGLDILIPSRRTVINCAGPHSFYMNSSKRTAVSKLQQQLLEAQGFKVVVLPYYEWGELRTPEEKQRYLWSLGRRAAAELSGQTSDGASCDTEVAGLYSAERQASVVSGLSDLSDLSDDPDMQRYPEETNGRAGCSRYGDIDYGMLLNSASEGELDSTKFIYDNVMEIGTQEALRGNFPGDGSQRYLQLEASTKEASQRLIDEFAGKRNCIEEIKRQLDATSEKRANVERVYSALCEDVCKQHTTAQMAQTLHGYKYFR